ncbi:sulfotransferase family protein [Spirillospora sp. NBC_01491]|uniref:sulfotransferase family protein n=1 Tax=Spirillospora sp. NBC_01491 TaxID=2976007 RepID=UPI002E300FBE|nr:sulfotransferase [Spirillospora sp. NBC_01491]
MNETENAAPTMLFVGGLHRSGTTLFASLMGTHPEISGFRHTGAPEDEGQHLQTVLPIDEHHGGPGRFAFAPDAYLTESSPYASVETARRLRAQWNRYWDLSKPILLEKSPPNLIRFRLLQELFPNSKFILMMRNPVSVTLSTRKWSPSLSHRDLVRHWLHAHKIAFEDARSLRYFMTVRYEDLMEDPERTMESVASFLDIPNAFATTQIAPFLDGRYAAQWSAEVDRAVLDDLRDAVADRGYTL